MGSDCDMVNVTLDRSKIPPENEMIGVCRKCRRLFSGYDKIQCECGSMLEAFSKVTYAKILTDASLQVENERLRKDNLQHLLTEIKIWHFGEFGMCSIKKVALKLLEEAAELSVNPSDHGEIADVMIVLLALASRCEVDLLKITREKFEIVRNRNQSERDEGK